MTNYSQHSHLDLETWLRGLRRRARGALRRVVELGEAALPLLLPPTDLRLQTGDGSTVTGILLVENNRVVAGLVVHHRVDPAVSQRGSHGLPGARPPYVPRGLRDVDDTTEDDDCRLPGWSDDTRGGPGSWRR